MASDPYLTAKASLRENVKTLVAVFSGIAGVLLAGSPFSGYGSLELFGVRWWVASIALLVALVLLGWRVKRLLFVLRPDLTYASTLTQVSVDKEVVAVQNEFARHRSELLPVVDPNDPNTTPIASLGDLIKAKSAAWLRYQKDTSNVDSKAEYDRLAEALESINQWSAFTRLHIRVSRGINETLIWGLPTLVAVAVFVLAASSKKDAAGPTVYVVAPGETRVAPVADTLPRLPPILFATDMADLTVDSLERARVARDYLRSHPNIGALVFANTDTRGGDRLNHDLAARRAANVVALLRDEGGISASRIFVASLAKHDLPVLTGPDAAEWANRSVEIVLIPLRTRGS